MRPWSATFHRRSLPCALPIAALFARFCFLCTCLLPPQPHCCDRSCSCVQLPLCRHACPAVCGMSRPK